MQKRTRFSHISLHKTETKTVLLFKVPKPASRNYPITTDGTTRGFEYDGGEICFAFMFSRTLTVGLRPKIVGSGNRKQAGFPLYGVESHTRLMLLLFCSTACSESEKNVLFAHEI